MKTVKFFLAFLMVGIIGGFLSLHFFSFRYIEKYLLSDDKLDLVPIEITEVREIVVRENEAITERIKRVERAVVGIRTVTGTGAIEGSGLIVSTDGLLVTFSDIVPFGRDFEFFVNGEETSYEIIERDVDSGLALVRLEKDGLPTVEFGNIDQLEIGERVFLVGAVFDEEGEIKKSANQGIIKRVDEYIRTNIFEESRLKGSTLFDIEGKVLGINLINQRGEVYSVPVFEIQELVGF